MHASVLRFLFSGPLLLAFGIVWFICWTFSVWTSPGAAGHLLQNASAEEILNVVSWGLAFFSLLVFAATAALKHREITPEATVQYYGVAILVAVTLVLWLAFAVRDAQNMSPFATVMGALLATAGWLTSAWLTVRNQALATRAAATSSQNAAAAAATAERKRHTLNILIEMRQNPIFNMHRDNIAANFPIGVALTLKDVADAETELTTKRQFSLDAPPRVGDSLRYVTNYYEFLCAALRQQDLDENLLKQTHRQILVGYVDKVRAFIDEMTRRNGDKTYEHLRAVIQAWKDDKSAVTVATLINETEPEQAKAPAIN